jgi:hypothetical protein
VGCEAQCGLRGANRGTQGAGCGAKRKTRRRSRDEGARDAARNASVALDARGSRFPGRGVAFRRFRYEVSKGEKDVRRCPPKLHGWAYSRKGKRGYGRRCKRDERKYLPTLHDWVQSSHQGSRERRFESWKRLRKIGSCSSLYSQKKPISIQSPFAAARKIRRGRARVFWRGTRGQSTIPSPSAWENAVEVGYA